jgi:hypothetical protein
MRIGEYRFGRVVVEGEVYTSDVIVYPDRVVSDWWRRRGHELCVQDIPEVLRERPEVLVVGKGSPGLMEVPPETRAALAENGIEVVVLPTEAACSYFNEVQARRRTVACLHLTC